MLQVKVSVLVSELERWNDVGGQLHGHGVSGRFQQNTYLNGTRNAPLGADGDLGNLGHTSLEGRPNSEGVGEGCGEGVCLGESLCAGEGEHVLAALVEEIGLLDSFELEAGALVEVVVLDVLKVALLELADEDGGDLVNVGASTAVEAEEETLADVNGVLGLAIRILAEVELALCGGDLHASGAAAPAVTPKRHGLDGLAGLERVLAPISLLGADDTLSVVGKEELDAAELDVVLRRLVDADLGDKVALLGNGSERVATITTDIVEVLPDGVGPAGGARQGAEERSSRVPLHGAELDVERGKSCRVQIEVWESGWATQSFPRRQGANEKRPSRGEERGSRKGDGYTVIVVMPSDEEKRSRDIEGWERGICIS